MCGIVGISYGPHGSLAEDWTPSEVLQILLPASVHRGPHAYGWMYLTDDGVIHVQKFKGRSDTREALHNMVIPADDEGRILWLVGHVRWYTNGSPDVMLNNHPIDHGKIVGVHNGVISNFQEVLDETGRQDPATEVDSEAIFAAIDKWGHRAGLRRIRGNMVAVYANREKPETLHIARTHGRPLEFCHTVNNSLMFASESGIMEATAMCASAYSSLSLNRLVRAKGGRIVERINLTPAPQAWRTFQGGPDYKGIPDRDDMTTALSYEAIADNWYRNPLAEQKRAEARAKGQELDQTKSDPKKVTRVTKPTRGGARSTHLRDGDRCGKMVYYKGLLLTETEYATQVETPKTALDEEA